MTAIPSTVLHAEHGTMAILLAGMLVVALFLTVVPDEMPKRYMTISKTTRTSATTQDAESALDSSNARRGLIENAFILTARHQRSPSEKVNALSVSSGFNGKNDWPARV